MLQKRIVSRNSVTALNSSCILNELWDDLEFSLVNNNQILVNWSHARYVNEIMKYFSFEQLLKNGVFVESNTNITEIVTLPKDLNIIMCFLN